MALPFSLHETQEKEGFIYKQAKGITGKSYEKKYIILHGMDLYFFKAKPKPGPKVEVNGSLNFKGASLQEEDEPGTPNSFAILIPKPGGKGPKEHWFKADTALQKKEWMYAIATKLAESGTSPVTDTRRLKMTGEDVITGLKAMYFEKMLDIEKRYSYDEFFSPLLKSSDFEAKPMVLLIGQYSVGKTTFVEYLLGQPYPGSRVGPEPTTDRFVAVMYGDQKRTIPGNALSVDQDKPFTTVSRFGGGFLNKFEGAMCSAEILKKVTFIDTPGILAGEKQRIGREYEFPEVVKWFAYASDAIILLFDAHKLDISDEMKAAIEALRGNDDKIKVILNKADQISTQQLVRVYGSLMWSLSKVIHTPECLRVYIGSFWNEEYKNKENEHLFEMEAKDLNDDLSILPRNSTVRKVNDLVKRARQLRCHLLILSYLKKQIPTFQKEKKQKELITNIAEEFKEISRLSKVPIGDFPPIEPYQKVLPDRDFSKFPTVNDKTYAMMEEILLRDLPNFMQMASPQSPVQVGDDGEFNPFSDKSAFWDVPLSFQNEMADMWVELSPDAEPLSGAQLKQPLLDTGAPPEHLKKIWALADLDKTGKLDQEQFYLVMWLAKEAAEGKTPPATLPDSLIPPSKKKDTLF